MQLERWPLFISVFLETATLIAALPAIFRKTADSHRSLGDMNTAAVLSARGEGSIIRELASTSGNEMCAESCDGYDEVTGASEDTLLVCMSDSENVCSKTGCSTTCQQRFEPWCPTHCSEWSGEANASTINVCQNREKRWKCSLGPCDAGISDRCRQKPIRDCFATCQKHSSEVSAEDDMVCQVGGDLLPKKYVSEWSNCLDLPCKVGTDWGLHDNARNFSEPCMQIHEDCPSMCSDGSKEGATCFVAGDCTNTTPCSGVGYRCQKRKAPVPAGANPEPSRYLSNTRSSPYSGIH